MIGKNGRIGDEKAQLIPLSNICLNSLMLNPCDMHSMKMRREHFTLSAQFIKDGEGPKLSLNF